MADKADKKIGEELRRITGTGRGERFPVMSGVVTAVDADNNECTVQLITDGDDTPTDGVLLNVVTANGSGVYLLPDINADCIVAEIDGPGKWELLRASRYTKISATIGSASLVMTESGFSINAGGKNLKTVMDNILNHILLMTVPTPTGNSGTPLNAADFNNDLGDMNNILM